MYFYSFYPQPSQLDRKLIESLGTKASDIEFFFRIKGFVLMGMTKRGHVIYYAADDAKYGLYTEDRWTLSDVLANCNYKHRIASRLPRNYKGSV